LDGMIEQREALKPINKAIDEGNVDKAIALINKEIQEQSKYITWCLRKLANLYYQKGEYELARKIYEDVLSKRDIGWAKLGMGKVQIALGDYQEAIHGLSDLLAQNGNLIEAYDWLAEAQLKKGAIKEAQQTLQDAVAISPFTIIRQAKLANICLQNKDIESATEALRNSVKLGHNSVYESPENYLNLGRCLSDLSEGDSSDIGKKRAKEAVQVLGRVSKRFKGNTDIKMNALLIESRVHKGQGNDIKSQTMLEQAKGTVDITEASAEATLEFAKTLYSMGEESQAEQMLSELAHKHGDNKSVMKNIEDLLDEPVSLKNKVKARKLNKQGIDAFEAGDLDEAIEVFGHALEVTPKHPALNLNLVQVLLKQIKGQGGNPLLKRQCEQSLDNVKHIPEQHRQFKRYTHLVKKVAALP